MSLNYIELNARAFNSLISIKKHTSSIDLRLRALIELRVSQLNGCAYCIDLHSNESRTAGESQQRLDCLTVWKESLFFSEREMAALQWTESVTHISLEPNIEEKLEN